SSRRRHTRAKRDWSSDVCSSDLDDSATVFVGVQIQPGSTDLTDLIAALESNDYPVTDLTQNETAKLHVRHMVGGYAALADIEELVYRVEFPERPGALLMFLNSLK